VKVLIVDDEAPARERIVRMLADLRDVKVVGEASSGREALGLIQQLVPDIVLLDIRMPEIDGMETARHLASLENGPAIIFTTAYDEYAIDAFDAQAIAYLLKPVRRERLEKALQHAAKLARPQLEALARESKTTARRANLCVRKAGGELKLIPITEILSFQADQKYVTVIHLNGEDLLDEPLKLLAEEFGDRFIRIHRSALVSLARVERLDKDETGQYQVWLKNSDEPLPVSRRHVTEVKTRLKQAY
jgi:two-component system response regulator AlgR